MAPLTMMMLAAVPSLLAAAEEPPELEHNPFSRPPTPVVRDEVRPESDGRATPRIVSATMVSQNSALANVEGRVMRPGEETRGYLLKRVYEDRAVFERNGNELTVYVKPELEEDDEKPIRNPRRR